MICFKCGLDLNNWKDTDDPVNKHKRFTPSCPWLLRSLGCQKVKYLYLKQNDMPTEITGIQNIITIEYNFIHDIEDIPGIKFNCLNYIFIAFNYIIVSRLSLQI